MVPVACIIKLFKGVDNFAAQKARAFAIVSNVSLALRSTLPSYVTALITATISFMIQAPGFIKQVSEVNQINGKSVCRNTQHNDTQHYDK